MKAKKVGIITFHRSYNYGSALQAYALQTYIEALGFNVKIIDFVLNKDFEQYKLFRTSLYKRQIQSVGADVLFFPYHLKRKINFETFAKKRMHLTKNKYFSSNELTPLNSEFDIFVCGSDQIWNIDCTHGVEPAYFLAFADDRKTKIAYAPSLAHIKFETDYKDNLKKLLERFDAISVREESTVPYLQSIVQKKIETALDPTLLLNSNEYLKMVNAKACESKYIFAYMLEVNAELIQYCERLKKKTGYQLYYLTSKVNSGFGEGKNLFGISPEEFLRYIYQAQYVVTNSFHATVFSILFNKKFCTFPTSKSSSRMVDLLEKLNMLDRIDNISFNIDNPINYKAVESRLEKLRYKSSIFLKNALTKKDHKNEN